MLRTCSENSRRNRHSTSVSECCLIFTSGELRESQHRYQHFISGRTASPCPRDGRPQTGCCLERPSFQSCLEPSPAGRVGSEGWETELPAALRPASPLHEPGGSQSCRGQGCGQGSGLAPGTGFLSCWPVPPTPRQGGGLRVHSWTLPQVPGSLLAGLSTQQLPGNDWRPGHESSFAVATWAWAAGGRGVLLTP